MKGGLARFRHSLSLRLTLLFLLLAAALTLVILGGIRFALFDNFRSTIQPHVEHYLDGLAAEIGDPPNLAKAAELSQRLPIRIRIEGPRVNWSSDGNADHFRERRPRRWGAPRLHVRILASGYRILFLWPRPDEDDFPLAGLVTLLLTALLVTTAFLLVRRLFHPLKEIHAGVARFGRGEFEQPIPRQRADELGELATEINGMAEELRRMLESKRQLLLAIAHELRSPLTRARLNLELLDAADSPQQTALLRDVQLMQRLIDDLLEGERLQGRHAVLRTEPIRLDLLLRETVEREFQGAAIRLDLPEAMPEMMLDPSRIELLIRNLVKNALRYHDPAADPVEVELRRDDVRTSLTVRDRGAGVAPEQLPHLTDPFYRTDTARDRETGGVGLGLHLCRLIAEAHGAELRIDNAAPGLRVSVEWLEKS